MKTILSIILLFITSFTNAQVLDSVASKTSQVVTIPKKVVKESITTIDTSSNFKSIYTDIKTGIVAMASALKVTAEHVYMVLVKQQIVNSILYLIVGLLAIVFGIICYKQWGKIECKPKTNSWSDDEVKEVRPLIFTLITGILSFILTLVFLFHIDITVMGFINPEYGAIKDIINIVQTHKLN